MKTTLIEAAKDVVTICKMYRTSLPLDVLSEIKSLEQAIAQEQKPKFTRFDVLVITTAYEQGYGKGLEKLSLHNPYGEESPAFHAWELGYEEGQMRLKQQSKEPKP